MNMEEWEEFPTYLELFSAVQNYLKKHFQETSFNSIPVSQSVYNFNLTDVIFVILSAVGWTFLRQVLTERIFKPLGRQYALTPFNQSKMPESGWKFLYFFSAWSVNYYILVLSGDYRFFQQPSSVWKGWSLNESLPRKIYLFYIAQCGFYLHSVYATIFMDTWRKDSTLMIIHHASTLILIAFSFALRCHNIGCLVLFLHDICDIFLEFSKLNVYFKIQDDKVVKLHDFLANVTFLSFTVVWFIARLYWYPLRVLYTGISDINGLQSVLPCSLLMNGLLWILQILNVYWYYLILQTLYRVATGQLAEDAREYDVEERFIQKQKKLS